jgi:SAM-dependent methyltransferase
MSDDHHEQNRRSWNAATLAHNSHKLDQAGFLRRGGSTLFPDERALLGELQGKRLLHLLCNSGQDTLSLAQLGAEVVGVDLSDEAIRFAQQLSADSGIPGTFVRSEAFEWLKTVTPVFDVVFSSYGFLGWLSALEPWAAGVQRALVPGGRLVFLEFHPLLASIGPDWKPRDPYFYPGHVFDEPIGDYVADSGEALTPSGFAPGIQGFQNPHPSAAWQWTVADVLTAILDAGLVLERYIELPYSNGCRFVPTMTPLPGNRFGAPPGEVNIPMMFGAVARRP